MKYTLCLLLILFLAISSDAQKRPLFIISTTKVYAMPSFKSKAIGVYARGGTANELKKFSNDWSEVIVENGDTAFIPSRFLVKSLNAADSYEQDPEDFVRPGSSGAEYGSPHLFVIAAGVKARAIFAKNKPVGKILRTNEPCMVSYLPYDENKLVKIDGGIFEKDRMLFTQRKFLGRKLNFNTTLQQYRNTADPNLKKQLAERIYEMSWRENKADNLLGVQTFRNYLIENNGAALYKELAFEEFLLKETQETIDIEDQLALFEKKPTIFTIQGTKLPFLFTEKDIAKINLPKKVVINGPNYPECGVEVTKEYQFANFKVYVSAVDSLTYIPEVNFKTNDISLTLAGFNIDHTTTETAFIQKLGGFISYSWLERPHVYVFPDPEAAAFVFYFKNGKIEKMEYFFYC